MAMHLCSSHVGTFYLRREGMRRVQQSGILHFSEGRSLFPHNESTDYWQISQRKQISLLCLLNFNLSWQNYTLVMAERVTATVCWGRWCVQSSQPAATLRLLSICAGSQHLLTRWRHSPSQIFPLAMSTPALVTSWGLFAADLRPYNNVTQSSTGKTYPRCLEGTCPLGKKAIILSSTVWPRYHSSGHKKGRPLLEYLTMHSSKVECLYTEWTVYFLTDKRRPVWGFPGGVTVGEGSWTDDRSDNR
jgi:hypothetical protein